MSERLLDAREVGLCARDYLAHVNAFDRNPLRDVTADALRHRPSGFLGLEHDHRLPVASVFGTSPVARNEARCLRDARHNVLFQCFLCAFYVADRDLYDHGMHCAPPVERQGAASLRRTPLLDKRLRSVNASHEPVAFASDVLGDQLGVVDEAGELQDQFVSERDAGDEHAVETIRLVGGRVTGRLRREPVDVSLARGFVVELDVVAPAAVFAVFQRGRVDEVGRGGGWRDKRAASFRWPCGERRCCRPEQLTNSSAEEEERKQTDDRNRREQERVVGHCLARFSAARGAAHNPYVFPWISRCQTEVKTA